MNKGKCFFIRKVTQQLPSRVISRSEKTRCWDTATGDFSPALRSLFGDTLALSPPALGAWVIGELSVQDPSNSDQGCRRVTTQQHVAALAALSLMGWRFRVLRNLCNHLGWESTPCSLTGPAGDCHG